MIDTEQIKFDALEKALNLRESELRHCETAIKRDPLVELCKIQEDFKKLLDDNPGDKRLNNPAFDAQVKVLANRDKKAKERAKTYNLLELMDRKTELQLEIGTLQQEIARMKFRMKK